MICLMLEWQRGGLLGLLLASLLCLSGVLSILLDGPSAPCPNPAAHCLQDIFNRVIQNQGCLGCQVGCQAGYMMTTNPLYFVSSDKPLQHYLYKNISVLNTVNVFEPQWLCLKGDTCRGGYFASTDSGVTSCSWCGEGCARCSSFNNCLRCFAGFTVKINQLPDQTKVTTCSHSDVLCPNPPNNCTHNSYVSAGSGCAGCQSCKEGYVVTYNEKYFNDSIDSSDTYDYQGLKIRTNIVITEPRFICVEGSSCQTGMFGAVQDGTLICTPCLTGCSQCQNRITCDVCKAGFKLSTDSKNNTVCLASSS